MVWVFFVIGGKKVAAQKNWIFGALHGLYCAADLPDDQCM